MGALVETLGQQDARLQLTLVGPAALLEQVHRPLLVAIPAERDGTPKVVEVRAGAPCGDAVDPESLEVLEPAL